MDNDEPNQGKQKKTQAGILVLIVVCAAVAGGVFLKKGQAQSRPAPVKSVLHLETFTVNLNDPEQRAFLRLGVDLELERARSAKEAGGDPVGLVRDTILSVLMATRPDELATADGKQRLKAQMLHALQRRAPELGVNEVFYTEFLMQQ